MSFFRRALPILAIALTLGACTRIETGKVGLRINASKEVQGTELMPGSWPQTVVGSVIEFPIRDVSGALENKKPLTKENVALADFDLTYVYSINPNSVSEIWTTRSKSLHGENKEGILLMQKYVEQLVNNSAYKAVRQYEALLVADKRAELEQEIIASVTETLEKDKLNTALSLNLIQIRAIVPPASILQSAEAVIRSQNELKVKENEVQIAKKEAERMQALSNNSQNSIQYMDAQARLNISNAILNGKVSTIVVPQDFKGIVQIK